MTTLRPYSRRLTALVLAAITVAAVPRALAYPYDSSLPKIPNTALNITGIETRTAGTDVIYTIPTEDYPTSLSFTITGADGGKATTTYLENQVGDGGGGAYIIANFDVSPTADDALRPGGELRLVVGSKGFDRTKSTEAGAGGGGGTAVLYRAPEQGASWVILAVAGGGGGGAANTYFSNTWGRDGKNANNTSSGDEGADNSDSGGTNGGAGISYMYADTVLSGGGGGLNNSKGVTGQGGLIGGEGGEGGTEGGFGFGGGGIGNSRGTSVSYQGKAGGGGGGGYSGGGGGNNGGGGGGGSFLHSWAGGVIATRDGDGLNGSVTISRTPSPIVYNLPGPTITLSGSSNITLTYPETYSDAGASATDVYGNTVSVSTSIPSGLSSGSSGTFTVTYTATDQFGKASTATRTVTRLEANKPTFILAGNLTVFEDDGSQTQSNFAYDFNANDAGQALVAYQVTNSDNALFSVQPAINNSGKLSYTLADNKNGTVTVTVVAIDNLADPVNGASDPVTFTITVHETNDPPMNLDLSNSTVVESLTAVGTVSAVEPFGQAITYAIFGGADSGLFALDPQSGALSFAIVTDYETPADSNQDNQYKVIITATGSDGTVSKTFTIQVTDLSALANLDEFRSTYGLAPDGSDDDDDWSQNGVSNLLYLAFGLGDPMDPEIDRERLPALTAEMETNTLIFSFVRPAANDSGLEINILTSSDLASWTTPDDLGIDYLPVSETTEELGDGHIRVYQTYNLHSDETSRCYRIETLELGGLD